MAVWNIIRLWGCGPYVSVPNLPCPEKFSLYTVWFSEIVCKLSVFSSEVQDMEMSRGCEIHFAGGSWDVRESEVGYCS